MRDELVFSKTRAGEDAVQERTRLVQRNLRMVLILVDGVVSVAGLKQEVGDPAMVESALAELESMGLIESPEAHEIPDASEIETMPAYPSKAVSPWEIETIPPIVASPPQSVLPDALPVAEPVQAAPVAQPPPRCRSFRPIPCSTRKRRCSCALRPSTSSRPSTNRPSVRR